VVKDQQWLGCEIGSSEGRRSRSSSHQRKEDRRVGRWIPERQREVVKRID
jgi:hypothetical protein